MKDYKKRAKGGWNCGKSCKHQSNKQERCYAKEEVRHEMEEYEQGDEFRYKHHAHHINKKVKLENKIAKYERWVNNRSETGLFGWWYKQLNRRLEKMRNEYKEKYGQEE